MHFCHEELFAIITAVGFAKPVYYYVKARGTLLCAAALSLVNLGCKVDRTTDVGMSTTDSAYVGDAGMLTGDTYVADAYQPAVDSGADAPAVVCPGLTDNMQFTATVTNCTGDLAMVDHISVYGRTAPVAGQCFADVQISGGCNSSTYPLPWTPIVRGEPGYGVESFRFLSCGSTGYQCQLSTNGEVGMFSCIVGALQCVTTFRRTL